MSLHWKHAGIAALTLAAATALRWLLDPWLLFRVPSITFCLAIVFIAWRTSTPVAIASTVASWLIAAYVFVQPRGSIVPVSIGDWIGWIAFFTLSISIVFIADRMRRALRRLEAGEHQLELISNRVPALISYVGKDRRYVWCNDEYTRWFGLLREQLVGRTLEEVLGADAWARLSPRIDAAFGGQVVEYESEARYARGGTRWIHVTYTPHKSADGEVQGIVAMVTDISERKRAERHAELLADLHEAFALIPSVADAAQRIASKLVERLDLSRCLLAEIDEDSDTIRVIQHGSREPEPSQAGDYRISDFLTDAERQRLAEGRPLVIDDVRVGRSPGAAARFEALGIGAVVSAPYVSEGKRKFALAAEKDTPYHWREDEVALLTEVAARLYLHLDRARAQESVREKADALVEADRRKDEFLATLAHELRNPLAPIRNGLYILKVAGKVEGTLGQVHAMLERQVKHLVRLIDDLMEVSRITRGHIELRREFTDVQAIVASAVETCRPAIDEAGHVLSVSLPPESLGLNVDPVRLAQVLTNLLINAAKFTERGGRISVTARREGPAVLIVVSDNGRGITPEMLPRIFDLFAQAGAVRHGAAHGLGIGLTLARRLVELHGGSLEAKSEGRGRGSEFTVRLPLGSAEAGPDLAKPATGAPGPSRRVLVVDDNPDAAESLGIVLALHGFETQTAHDGRSAFEALESFRPSVMLLDLGMPGLNGYEVAERVRQHPAGRDLTIVALTGRAQAEDRRRSQDAGIDHYIVKPVDLEFLRELLASLPAGSAAA